MRTTRTTAVVLAGAALGLPAVAAARNEDETGVPPRVLLRAPVDDGASVIAHRRAHHADHLRTHAVHLARALDRAHDRKVRARDERRRVHRAAVPRLRHRVRVLEHRLDAARTPAPPTSSAASPALESIAACESGGDPAAVGGGGAYRGKYQFDLQTWESVGGTGDPAAASEAEQDQRASILYSREGTTPWPVCGG
jgi:Transglycosylase-like domain